MKTFEIKNAGTIEYELLDEFGNQTQTIEEFLIGIIKFIAKQSVPYYTETNGKDHIFLDSEGELNTVVTQAITDNTILFKREFPMWREYSTTKSGNLDYWIQYDNIAIAMELKLAHKGSIQGDCNVKQSIYDHFNKALKQLENIETTDLFFLKENTKGLLKLVFQEIVLYSKNTTMFDDSFESYQEKIKSSFNTLFDDTENNPKGLCFDKAPNMRCVWHLDKEIAYVKKGRFDEDRVYPSVGFIARIDYKEI